MDFNAFQPYEGHKKIWSKLKNNQVTTWEYLANDILQLMFFEHKHGNSPHKNTWGGSSVPGDPDCKDKS